MMKKQWYAVCLEKFLKAKPQGLRRFGRNLVLWRGAGDEVVCALDVCCHRAAALSRGRTIDGCLSCPYHGLRFDNEGSCVYVPAQPAADISPRFKLKSFPVRRRHGLIWVYYGEKSDTLPPLPWSDDIDEELVGEGGVFVNMAETLPVNYLRVMENLSDFHHVAHVHRHTAPTPAEVIDFEARREGGEIWVRGVLGNKDSKRRLEATTHIVAPFLAVLEFKSLARFLVVATPVDENNVWLFARYTQTAIRIAGLNFLLTWLLGTFDYRMLQRMQDLPVWKSQQLPLPSDISRYSLLPADEGIRLYFQIHQELMHGG